MESSMSGSTDITTASPSAATTITIATTTTTADADQAGTDFSGRTRRTEWPTVDGPLGLSEQDSVDYARRFFKLGFLLLPFLWAVNCFYFWPVLRHSRYYSHSQPLLRRYVIGSAVGFLLFAVVLSSWALTFSIGGERLFGHVWNDLVMYNVADRWGLTGWI